jgi:hypothetical protein
MIDAASAASGSALMSLRRQRATEFNKPDFKIGHAKVRLSSESLVVLQIRGLTVRPRK